jgi:hypothetical protein
MHTGDGIAKLPAFTSNRKSGVSLSMDGGISRMKTEASQTTAET